MISESDRLGPCAHCVVPCVVRKKLIETQTEQAELECNLFDVLNSEETLFRLRHVPEADEWRPCRIFVSRIVYARSKTPQEIDDAIQEAMRVLITQITKFDGRAKLTTWIYSIVLYTISNMTRAWRRRQSHEGQMDSMLGEKSPLGDPEQHMQKIEMWDAIQQGFAHYCEGITPGKRKRNAYILDQILRERRNLDDIAAEFGVSRRLVYQIRQEALQAIREVLDRQ